MKAVLVTRFGPAAEVAEVAEVPDPAPPGPGQVLIDILAAPINPSDFLVFEGRFGATPPPLPAPAGGEAVGQVAALGEGVTTLKVGDRILALHAGRGNWRQRVLAPAAGIRALPAAADPLQLAMLAVNPATALHMLTRYVALSPGEWLIQNAGNSAVGHCVIWLARQRGLRTVSVVRRADQVAPLLATGGDIVLVDGPDLPARAAAATGGQPIRLGIDAVAGSATARLARCLAPRGTVVVYGLLSSPDCTVPASELVFRDIALRGYWFTPWFERASADDRAALYAELGQLVVDGTIRVAIEACYPLDRVRDALTHAASPDRSGKILLLPNPHLLENSGDSRMAPPSHNLPQCHNVGLKKTLSGVAMSAIAAALPKLLDSIERPGDFAVGGLRPSLLPAIDVDGVGRIAFPVLPTQAEQLIVAAEAAPYGRGPETVVDRDVRRTWQVATGSLRVGGRHWDKTLAEIVAEAARGLGVTEPVAADFYKLLIYDAGSFFVDHRDTEKVPGMFATLVIVLPSAHSGGELIVHHLGREVRLDLRPDDPSELGFAAFYADCVHEVRPVVSGYRLTLVYNLRFLKKKGRLDAPDYRKEQARISKLLKGWDASSDEPDKLILPLEHAYTPAELSFGTLKGADAGMASVLVRAADEADCDLHLALMTVEESGSAEQTAYYSRGRWRGGVDEEADDGEEFDIVEVFDQSMTLAEWRRPDGSTGGLGDLPFDEKELCPPDAFEDMTPDEQHFHEATGNEGASFERTYRRAGLVLWPRTRRLAVLNHAGLRGSLPYLEDLVARWQASGAAVDSPLRREAEELSRHMLRTWSRNTWRSEDDTSVSRALDLQVRLSNTAWIDSFLDELSAQGHYAASDNGSIVRAVALLPAARATELLVRIVKRNIAAHLAACGNLLLRCATAPAGSTGDLTRIGTALLDSLPDALPKPEERTLWSRPAPMTPQFVVDLLSATSRIDARLAERAIEHVLARPGTYEPDDVLVPAALALARQKKSAGWPAIGRLRQAILDHLNARIALPLEAPRDWARPNPLTCKCPDCRQLGTFLLDPARRQWLFRAPQAQRSHVEGSVRNTDCDLDLATEKRGSPHTLIATKNQASYESRSKQRREDIEHVSALGG